MASTVYETEISLSATRYNLGLKQDLLERNIEGYEQDFEIVNREFILSMSMLLPKMATMRIMLLEVLKFPSF